MRREFLVDLMIFSIFQVQKQKPITSSFKKHIIKDKDDVNDDDEVGKNTQSEIFVHPGNFKFQAFLIWTFKKLLTLASWGDRIFTRVGVRKN